MAQFRAQIQGQRGTASRLGSRRSGIWARVDGWSSGVQVHGWTDAQGLDHFEVRQTAGSHSASGALLAHVTPPPSLSAAQVAEIVADMPEPGGELFPGA